MANLSQESVKIMETKSNFTTFPLFWTCWASHLHTIWRTHNYQAALDHWQISPVASNEENSVDDSIHAGKPWHDGAMVSWCFLSYWFSNANTHPLHQTCNLLASYVSKYLSLISAADVPDQVLDAKYSNLQWLAHSMSMPWIGCILPAIISCLSPWCWDHLAKESNHCSTRALNCASRPSMNSDNIITISVEFIR